MCTVSWVQQPGGYHLLSNRDEKRTRGKAFAPILQVEFGVRYMAPVDPPSRGTWIAVNEFGLAFCMLNGQADFPVAQPRRSRGVVIRELVWVRCIDDGAFLLNRLDLTGFAPFTLALLEPGRPATLAHWSGRGLTIARDGDPQMPLTSSSYDAAAVRRFRLQEFARRAGPAACVNPALLYHFHASHGASPNAYSPCMHREDAETVSFSWVAVTREEIHFLYSPSAPCRHSPCEQRVLMRAA